MATPFDLTKSTGRKPAWRVGIPPTPPWAIDEANQLAKMTNREWVVVFRPRLVNKSPEYGFHSYDAVTLRRTPISEPHAIVYRASPSAMLENNSEFWKKFLG